MTGNCIRIANRLLCSSARLKNIGFAYTQNQGLERVLREKARQFAGETKLHDSKVVFFCVAFSLGEKERVIASKS